MQSVWQKMHSLRVHVRTRRNEPYYRSARGSSVAEFENLGWRAGAEYQAWWQAPDYWRLEMRLPHEDIGYGYLHGKSLVQLRSVGAKQFSGTCCLVHWTHLFG